MTDRPIPLVDEMVRAYLAGRKSQTRRVIIPQPVGDLLAWDWIHARCQFNYKNELSREYKCPYGKPGDRLWVREPWKIASYLEGEPMQFQYRADGGMAEENSFSDCTQYEDWYERVSRQSSDYLTKIGWPMDADGVFHWDNGESPLPWRSSRFMPRWASRLTPEILEVRVERVDWINDIDAYAEGMIGGDCVSLYRDLWNSLNAKRGYGWETNPWVWVLKLKKAMTAPILPGSDSDGGINHV